MPVNIARPQNGDYQDFFRKKLEDYGVSSPAEMDEETKRKFFSEIELEWTGENGSKSVKDVARV